MRNLVILTCLVATTSLAAAEPSVTTTLPAGEPPVTSYLQGGVVTGGMRANSTDSGSLYGAFTLEGGMRLGPTMWLHGQLAKGTLVGFDEGSSGGDFVEARLGVEARRCVWSGIACAVAGVDVGLRREQLMADYDHFDSRTGVLVPRVGLDLGSTHLRVRPSFEVALGTDGNGGGLSLGLAYVW